jgi:hypothetical protein
MPARCNHEIFEGVERHLLAASRLHLPCDPAVGARSGLQASQEVFPLVVVYGYPPATAPQPLAFQEFY